VITPSPYFDAPLWARILELANQYQPPFLLVHLDTIKTQYLAMQAAFAPWQGQIFYALKANPMPPVVKLLHELGSSFELASGYELDLALHCGVPATKLCFGNTIKKKSDIAKFYAAGVRLFATDSEEDLYKLAEAAPGANIYVRILVRDSEATAAWPLARKFGCDSTLAIELLRLAHRLGLPAYGISFHVGSQQSNIPAWKIALQQTADLFATLAHDGITLQLVNIGGGFSSRYLTEVPTIETYATHIGHYLHESFRHSFPQLMMEPGRYLVAPAGVIVSEVMLVSRKSNHDRTRWVYTDIGVFGGLTEALGEATRYPILTEREGPTEEVILAGPTCDGRDIMYEQHRYALPADLQAGDRLYWLIAGAYTTSCSCVSYNGFPPLAVYFL